MNKTAFLLSLLVIPAMARDIHLGRDTDAPTIAHAIKAAMPGDTIHLEPKVYRDYAGFYAKKGEPGKPVTLDGHGATLEGSDPLNPAQWREVSPGLHAADNLLRHLDDAVLGRWFFIIGGRMQHMGRTSKGRSAPFKRPEDLQPGEWTFVSDPAHERLPSRQIHGAFYIRTAPGVKLEDAGVFVPVRSAGVQFSGDNAHLVIRNVTATHVYNDGFNIHGDCRDVVFENITAIECGDDGISAHESAQYRVDGFVSVGNSTGITDTGTARTSYNHVFIARCLGHDLFFLDEGRYTLTNALVLSSAQHAFDLSGRASGDCHMKMDNVLIRRLTEPRLGNVTSRAVLEAADCTFENMDVKVTGHASWTRCMINGKAQPAESTGGGAREAELMKLVPKDFKP